MGLKTTNYFLVRHNLTIANAYALITGIQCDRNKMADIYFSICGTREDMFNFIEPLEVKSFKMEVDPSQPIWSQAYEKAKETIFEGWEDDIVPTERSES